MAHNPFTFEAFADWIRDNRQIDRIYDWSSCRVCACAQYAHSLGISDWENHIRDGNFWDRANQIACAFPRTYGALEQRLRTGVIVQH